MGAASAGCSTADASDIRGGNHGLSYCRPGGRVMAINSARRSRFGLLRCLLSAWRTQLGLTSFAIALSVTWGGLWLAGWGLEKSQPVETVISSVSVLQAPSGSTERTLRVDVTAPPAGNCMRFSQHLLRQTEAGVLTSYPLGSSMSGNGFDTGSDAAFGVQPPPPPNAQEFVLMLSIPASVPNGKYEYIFRSIYTCLWLGGFVQRRIFFEAPPVPFQVVSP